MECGRIQEKLSAYIEDIVSQEERSLIEGHLNSCLRCRQSLADLKRTIEHIKNLEEIEPPRWLTQKIMARVRAEAEPKKGMLKRLFYPLHVKVPIGAIATIAIAITTIYIFKTIQPELKPAEAPVEIIAKDKLPATMIEKGEALKQSKKPVTETTTQKDKIASLSARNDKSERKDKFKPMTQQPSPAKEPEALGKLAEAPKAPAPVSMQDETLPSSGAVAKEEMSRESLTAAPRAKTLVKSKKEGISLTINVKDIKTASKEIEKAITQFDGKVIKIESFENKNVVISEFDSKKMKELSEKLKQIGEVKEKTVLEGLEGNIEMRIEIVKSSSASN